MLLGLLVRQSCVDPCFFDVPLIYLDTKMALLMNQPIPALWYAVLSTQRSVRIVTTINIFKPSRVKQMQYKTLRFCHKLLAGNPYRSARMKYLYKIPIHKLPISVNVTWFQHQLLTRGRVVLPQLFPIPSPAAATLRAPRICSKQFRIHPFRMWNPLW